MLTPPPRVIMLPRGGRVPQFEKRWFRLNYCKLSGLRKSGSHHEISGTIRSTDLKFSVDENSAGYYEIPPKLCLVLVIIKSKLSARHHLRDSDCGRAVGRLKAGQSITTVAAAVVVSKSIISRLKKASEGGNAL
ncbi:hypothetical protein TNCV_3835561 [Trichonephila clavipes]|nr:hypothetical protein TNCV_3835561 [Trichonephila clavipes]